MSTPPKPLRFRHAPQSSLAINCTRFSAVTSVSPRFVPSAAKKTSPDSRSSPPPSQPIIHWNSSGSPPAAFHKFSVASTHGPTTPSSRKKRKRTNKENEPEPSSSFSPHASPYPAIPHHLSYWHSILPVNSVYAAPHSSETRPTAKNLVPGDPGMEYSPQSRKRSYYREADKLSMLLKYIHDEIKWTIGDVLYALFERGKDIHRDSIHAGAVSSFLQGRMQHTPAEIIDLWVHHPFSHISEYHPEYKDMYSTRPNTFKASRHVSVALTSFAVETVMKKMVSEAEQAVQPESGLHASRKRKRGDEDSRPSVVQWEDIGAATTPRAASVFQCFQPVTRALLLAVAERGHAVISSEEEGHARKQRPAELVVSNAISNLDFSRTNRANLIPLARGLLHFALSTPYDVFLYQSRIGNMPAYSTVIRTLESLAQQEAAAVRAHGRDATTVGGLISDNVQNYLQQRDPCLGRVNTLTVGMAATYVEYPDCPVEAVDFDDRQQRIKENTRASLTVNQLFSLIDQRHVETTGILLLLRVLVNHIPELTSYQKEVSIRYRSRAQKLAMPSTTATKVHPLGTSGKNETITTDLKDAVFDFLGQVGQEREQYTRQLVLFCGDGLTFEKAVLLKYISISPKI